MSLEVRHSGAPLGHEIAGVELSTINNEDLKELVDLYATYGVVVVRNQTLTPEEHVEFSRKIAPLERFFLERYNLPEHPEIFVVSNIIENGKPIGMGDAGRYWHSDMWLTEHPPLGSILYAREVPQDDDGKPLGDTLFASTAYAYDTLPADLKALVDGKRATFSSAAYAAHAARNQEADIYSKEHQEARKDVQDKEIEHDLVRVHPLTGRKCLYVSEGAIRQIEGLSEEDSQRLAEQLVAHITREEVVYRHKWQVGDVVLWDNYSAVHCATGGYQLPQRRLMHRTTLAAPQVA